MPESNDDDLDLVWGVREIAKQIKRPVRQTQHLIDTNRITTGKIGRQRISTKRQLREDFAKLLKSEGQ